MSMTRSSFRNYFMTCLLRNNVLREGGNFLLSSNETSQYYYDFNQFNNGKALNELGFSYYKVAKEYFKTSEKFIEPFEVIYGCAYKGISIAMAISTYAWGFESKSYPWTFNRKEIKDHGDLSILVGTTNLEGRDILFVDDVYTTGGSIEKNLQLVRSFKPRNILILVGVNRSGVADISVDGIPVHYIVSHEEVIYFKDYITRI